MLRSRKLGLEFASCALKGRALSAVPKILDNEKEVMVEGIGFTRKAILNRPKSLNAFTTSMVSQLHKLYQAWEDHPDVGHVLLKGTGDRAFCCGGDVVKIYQSANKGKVEECKDFFNKAYRFMYLVGTYAKPHVALLDGLTMGGGAGISVPGTFSVVTDKTVFAIPEVHIGFHPDAGASFFLSHLPGYLGEYLALTGERLNGAEMLAAGLATHFTVSTRLKWIEERIGSLATEDPSVVKIALEEYSDVAMPDAKSCLRRMDAIDRCFSKDTVEDIICALETEAAGKIDVWYANIIGKLKEASPLSLKIALKSIREGRFQSLDQCLAREYRITCHKLSKKISDDFYEGIRARLIDKDSSPKWNPPCLEGVSREIVDQHFLPLGLDGLELELPVKQREVYI